MSLEKTVTRGHFFFRAGLLLVGATLAIVGAAFVRVNALRLDQIHPFFEDFDFYMGLVFLTGVLLLTWFHWGLILTSLIALTVIYFFFGHYVTIPILMLPEYDPNFVMNYLGLGLAEGMFWFARVAADNIYFLIIYASLLLGVGMLNLVIEVGKVAGNHVRGGAWEWHCCFSHGTGGSQCSADRKAHNPDDEVPRFST